MSPNEISNVYRLRKEPAPPTPAMMSIRVTSALMWTFGIGIGFFLFGFLGALWLAHGTGFCTYRPF